MDDLRQTVRNASYEQKDPLIIYKLEGYKSFERYLDTVNKEIVSFLTKASIAVEQENQVQEHREIPVAQDAKIVEKHSDYDEEETPREVKSQPFKSEKIFSRNDIVTVQYQDGTILKEVKFKKVENDLAINKCIVIENE
jgi:preprotein translocase subunit SecA